MITDDHFTDLIDDSHGARRRLDQLMDQLPINPMVDLQVIRVDIHQLNGKVDAFGVGIGLFFADDVLFAQDRHVVLDEQIAFGAAVADHGATDNHAFVGL